jgi:hypothetical protein
LHDGVDKQPSPIPQALPRRDGEPVASIGRSRSSTRRARRCVCGSQRE